MGAKLRFTQQTIVFVIFVALFAAFALFLPGFASTANLLTLLQNVAVLGILGLAMAVVVIGRGIDLSIVATMAIPVAWVLFMMNQGVSTPVAFALGVGLSLAIGVLNGFFIAYVEVPALFATLAMGTFIYGFGRSRLFNQDINALDRKSVV